MNTTKRSRLLAAAVSTIALIGAFAIAATESGKIVPDDVGAGDQFGAHVSLEGDLAAIGATGADAGAGAGYIYRNAGGTWTKEDRVVPSDAEPQIFMGIGASASPSPHGDVAVFGAVFAQGDPGVYSGAAYVFRKGASGWTQEAKLFPSGLAAFAFLGFRAEVSGDVCIVSAPNDDPLGGASGATYVWRYNGSQWASEGSLYPSLGGPGDQSGTEISISTSGGVERVLVGNPGDDTLGTLTGSATVFRREATGWIEEEHLTPDLPVIGEWFGRDVEIRGDLAIIGAPRGTGVAAETGVAYIFRRDETGWDQEAMLFAPDGEAGDRFGFSVGIDGDQALVGVFGDDGGVGSLYSYRWDGSIWAFVAKLTASDGAAGDGFADTLTVHGASAIVGAYQDDGDAGAIYLYDLAPAPLTDADGDGLYDTWETNGFTAANGEFVDLPSMGADPQRKDVFVEIDYMTGQGPSQEALDLIVAAFASAPVANPDGSTGITLHCNVDDEVPFVELLGGESTPGRYDWQGSDPARTYFQAIKDDATYGFTPSLAQVSHYCLFAHKLDFKDQTASGISRGSEETGYAASEFIVSLGAVGVGGIGSVDQQAGTFMHELGHDLGLRHGGGDSTNRKPNYLSVMNYFFQMSGLVHGGAEPRFTYSCCALPDLDENALDEQVGLNGGSAIPGLGTKLQRAPLLDPETVADANGPIDWNGNGVIDKGPNDEVDWVSANINGAGGPVGPVPGSVLTGFDDWSNLVYRGGSVGATGATLPPAPPTTEPPQEVDATILANVGPPAPDNLKGHPTDPQTTLTWSPVGAPGGGSVTYNVYRSRGGNVVLLVNTAQSNYHDKDATEGLEYVYSVATVDAFGTEGPSAAVTIVSR